MQDKLVVFHHGRRHQSSSCRQQAVHACYHALMTFHRSRPGPRVRHSKARKGNERSPQKYRLRTRCCSSAKTSKQRLGIISPVACACTHVRRRPSCQRPGRIKPVCRLLLGAAAVLPRLNPRKSKQLGAWNAELRRGGKKSKSFSGAPSLASSARTGQESAATGRAGSPDPPSPSDDTLDTLWKHTTQV